MNKHTILIANRGEIAMRIMRACQKLQIPFVALTTAADEQSEHCTLAKEIGGKKSLYRISSYQDANELFSVADESGATAIHPGYGFFAEDYRFARRVVERRRPLVFIGPSWQVIQELGDKINTKRLARKLGVPTVPGSDKPVVNELEAEAIAKDLFAFQKAQKIKHPIVLIKAAAGGGGMGIEEIEDLDEFRHTLRRIQNYARRQFRDESVLIEQRIFNFNHLEVQILADRKGENIVHFGTRNCSIQSTGKQKRIEVAPGFSPQDFTYAFNADKVLSDITEYSLRMAREIKYDNVGTWEWIISRTGEPFLMEVNTRIQVENGVSACISRCKDYPIDLIAEQIRCALGQPLGYSQKDIKQNGIGIEYRIVAEQPEKNFMPWVGRIDEFRWKQEDWLQVFTQIPTNRSYDIPTDFDPNLALAIIWGENLAQAKTRGKEFLDTLVLKGQDSKGGLLCSNIAYLKQKTDDILNA